jgi:hypothetical protein
MKTKTLIFAVAIPLIWIFIAQAAVGEDFKDMFLGIKWGDSAIDYPFLRKEHDKGKVVFYSAPSRIPLLFGREIPQAIYGFYSNQFFAVFFNIDRLEDFGILRENLKKRFGRPKISYSAKNDETTFRWKNKPVKIKMKENPRRMKIAFYYVPLSAQLNEESLEAATEGRVRFFPIEPDKTPKQIPVLSF